MDEDELEIIIHSDIPTEIRKMDHISEVRKIEMARMLAEGKITLQKLVNKKKGITEDQAQRYEMILEILIDRTDSGGEMTIDEIIDMLETPDANIGKHMMRIGKMAKEKNMYLKKSIRLGKTVYVIVRPES